MALVTHPVIPGKPSAEVASLKLRSTAAALARNWISAKIHLDDDLEQVRSDVSSPAVPSVEKVAVFRARFELLLEAFRRIEELNRQWRGSVFRGDEPFSPQTDADLRSLYAVWQVVGDAVREKADYFERHGSDFKPMLEQLAADTQKARQTFRTWLPPGLSLSPALRTYKVSTADLDWARSLFDTK